MAKTLFSRLESDLSANDTQRAAAHAADKAGYKAEPKKAGARITDKVRTWVVMADVHYPEQENSAIAAIFDFLQKNFPRLRRAQQPQFRYLQFPQLLLQLNRRG